MKGFTVWTLLILLLLSITFRAAFAGDMTEPLYHEPLSLLAMEAPLQEDEQALYGDSSKAYAIPAHESLSMQDYEQLSPPSENPSISTELTHESTTLLALEDTQTGNGIADTASVPEDPSAMTHEPSSIYVDYEPSFMISADSPQVKKADGKDTPKKTPVKVNIGNWNEWDRLPNKKGDYAFNYYAILIGKLHLRYDYFNLERSRYWVNYGQVPFVKSSWLNFNWSPGVMWINGMYTGKRKEIWFFGGHFVLSLPKLGFTVLHKGYGSNEGPFHQTFADLKVCKWLDISGYNLSTLSANPDTYVGPKVKIPCGGVQFSIWYGISTNPSRPDAKMLNCATHITF